MDSIRKDRFKRSLLSSAILISMQSFTASAAAGTCPPANVNINVQVAQENDCHTGIDLNRTSIVGSLENSDEIHADTGSAISLSAMSIGLDFINTGDLYAATEEVETTQRGISIEGDYYEEGELELESQVTIGRRFDNSGDIQAVDEGIFVTDTTVGPEFSNSGDITSLTSAGIALVDDVIITGSFNNTGAITSALEGIIFEGERSLDRESGGVITEKVAQVGAFMNQGTINSGETGIEIYDAQIGSTFINKGAITAEEGHGIRIGGISSIGQTFLNDGDIIADDSGIFLDGVEVNGEFRNNGVIHSGEGSAIDIESSLINGDVVNTGQLIVTEEDEGNHGISLENSHVKGSILNSGNIDVDGTEGIYLEETLVEGSIYNDKGVTINAYSDAILLDDYSTVQGDLINHGTLIARNHDGIDIDKTNIGGDIFNTGTITSGDNAFELDGEFDGPFDENIEYMVITGSLINTGNLTTREADEDSDRDGNGFDMDYVDIRTNLTNSGDINSIHHGFLIEKSIIGGNFSNSGNLTVAQSGIVLEGIETILPPEVMPVLLNEEEEQVSHRVDIGGYFYNKGIINAGQTGIALDRVDIGTGESTEDGAGNFENHGKIEVTRGTVIDINASTMTGNFINSGDLTADTLYVYQEGDSYRRNLEPVPPVAESAPDENPSPFTLAAVGADDQGNQWFRVAMSDDYGWSGSWEFMLVEENGDFAFTGQSIADGEAVYINAGQLEGDVVLSFPYEDFELQASPNEDTFAPEYDPRNGILITDTSISGGFSNTGTINAYHSGIELSGVDLGGGLSNSGTINAREKGILLAESDINGSVVNLAGGVITTTDGPGMKLYQVNGVEDFINYGTINFTDPEDGGDGMQAHQVSMSGVMANAGTINADYGMLMSDTNTTGFINNGIINSREQGMYALNSFIDGNIEVGRNGVITSADSSGINLYDVQGVDSLINEGIINSGKNGISLSEASDVREIINSGTITAANGAAISVRLSTAGKVTNTGIISGGLVTDDDEEEVRSIPSGSKVSLDFRTAGSRLDLLNSTDGSGNSGRIAGDIYGSSMVDDRIELSSGLLNGDIYDVETIDITGTASLNSNIFSINDSSTLNVTDSGTLAFGAADAITIEGDYHQDGTMAVALNTNTRILTEPVISASGSATFNEGSSVLLSVDDRNIANFNPGFAGESVLLVQADDGVSDNGVTVVSDSILFNYTPYTDNEDTGFGVIGTVSDLGTLANNSGASSNAVTAISLLQGDDSEGLVNLYNSNPDLYNAIYDADLAGLTQLAELLIAGNPGNSIAASQNAQNEAINTILNRIADLRSGASGITAGDSEANSLRPDSLWIRAIYSDGDQNSVADNDGYSLRIKGFTIGADQDINDYLTLGLGMTMVTSTANQTGAGSETDSYLGSLYAGWRNQDYFVDANLNLGSSKTDIRVANWDAQYDANQLALSVLAGKSFLFNNNDSLVEPSVGVNFTRLKSDSYSYGSTDVGATSLQSLELGAGIRYMTSFDMGTGQLLPEVSLMAWHDFKAEAVKTEIGFENSGGSFTYSGPEAMKNRYQASAGVEYWMDNNFTLSLNYDHNWQSGFKADTVQAKLRYDF